MRCVRVVIADRHPVVLQGLMNLLREGNGFKVVASCGDGTSCIEAIRRLVPDIAMFDNSMPGLTGLEILDIANAESLPTRLGSGCAGDMRHLPAGRSAPLWMSVAKFATIWASETQA
jgi:CheY-like chemotaxis protein